MASEPAGTPEVTAAPTALDPCALVPADEAGTLAGVKFDKGEESTFSGNGKMCTYGGQTFNVFSVVVAQAPDQQTADAAKADVVAQMKSALNKGVTIQTYPDVADGAAIATGQAKVGGQEINVIGFYALKGTVFVSFASVALGKPAPTSEQMLAEAQTVLDRIP